MNFDFLKKLIKPADTKIAMIVLDGLGGLPEEPGGQTELEAAHTPNLDVLAKEGMSGLHLPVGPGIMPGSGPAHLALFGYDPVIHDVGRGVLSALGVEFDLAKSDVAARGNFCTIDSDGTITDRRAGRISTEKNEELCKLLREIKLPGVELFIETVKEHRFLFVIRGKSLSGSLVDTDPHEVGKKPRAARPISSSSESKEAEKTADIINQFIEKANKKLADRHPANSLLLRGFAKAPDWPSMSEVYGLNPAAIAAYPMYRGVGKLIGMTTLEAPDNVEKEFDVLEKHWDSYDFFYLHAKHVDSSGEDGNSQEKRAYIEEVDEQIPRLRALAPDVVIVTGDHSTPTLMKSHSWHPVPVIMHGDLVRPDNVEQFGERNCITGGLGPRFPAVDIMPLALAHAGRIDKFGA